MKIASVICTYEGAGRVRWMLNNWKAQDLASWERHPLLICVDPSQNDLIKHAHAYDDVRNDFGCGITHLPQWGGLMGCAAGGFNEVIRRWNPEWIIYWGDDNAFGPGYITQLYDFIEQNNLDHVGLLQPSYTNAHEMKKDGTPFTHSEWERGPEHWKEAQRMFPGDTKREKFFSGDWPSLIKTNPHWHNAGVSRSYLNVNGWGFAVKREVYEAYGFPEKHHRIDEHIAYKCWKHSGLGVVTVPMTSCGVHYFAASSDLSKQPKHNFASADLWLEEEGVTVAQADRISRERMKAWENRESVQNMMRNIIVPWGQPSPEDQSQRWRSDDADCVEKGMSKEELDAEHEAYWGAME